MKSLRVVLIPTANEYILLPQGMITNIYPYAPPLSVDNPSPFVMGCILIQNEKLPLLDFNFKDENEKLDSSDSSGYHFVLVKTISQSSPYRTYAILSHGEPYLYEINEDEVKYLQAGNHSYIAQIVDFNHKKEALPVVILDVANIEKELRIN